MQNFPLCEECRAEYVNPLDRRFHTQTLACKKCEPHVFLIENDGKRLKSVTPIRDADNFIGEGYIVVVKGIDGLIKASLTYGTYDVWIEAQLESMEELDKLV